MSLSSDIELLFYVPDVDMLLGLKFSPVTNDFKWMPDPTHAEFKKLMRSGWDFSKYNMVYIGEI